MQPAATTLPTAGNRTPSTAGLQFPERNGVTNGPNPPIVADPIRRDAVCGGVKAAIRSVAPCLDAAKTCFRTGAQSPKPALRGHGRFASFDPATLCRSSSSAATGCRRGKHCLTAAGDVGDQIHGRFWPPSNSRFWPPSNRGVTVVLDGIPKRGGALVETEALAFLGGRVRGLPVRRAHPPPIRVHFQGIMMKTEPGSVIPWPRPCVSSVRRILHNASASD